MRLKIRLSGLHLIITYQDDQLGLSVVAGLLEARSLEVRWLAARWLEVEWFHVLQVSASSECSPYIHDKNLVHNMAAL